MKEGKRRRHLLWFSKQYWTPQSSWRWGYKPCCEMQRSGCVCECVYENMCILRAVWYISLLYCGTMILHSSVLPSLWCQSTSYYTACAPCPCNPEFRQNLFWLAHVGFGFFPSTPYMLSEEANTLLKCCLQGTLVNLPCGGAFKRYLGTRGL